MRGKVKYVKRVEWYTEDRSTHWYSDVHARRHTRTYAMLYNHDEVVIDEDDIRNYYDRNRITYNLIQKLNDDLHNVWIEYYEDNEDYYLDGDLEDYI